VQEYNLTHVITLYVFIRFTLIPSYRQLTGLIWVLPVRYSDETFLVNYTSDVCIFYVIFLNL